MASTEDTLFEICAALVKTHRQLRTYGKIAEATRLQAPTQAIMDLAVELRSAAIARDARTLAKGGAR